MTFESRLYSKEFLLNDTDNLIIDYIKKHLKQISNMSIHEISRELYISPNSIMRFSKKIGYSGFSELKFSLSKTEETQTSTNKVLENVPKSIIKTIDFIDHEVKKYFVDEILKARKILFVGVGDSAFPCESIGRSLRFLGLNTEYYYHVHDTEYVASKYTEKDLVIFISGRGANERLVKMASLLKRNNIKRLAITKYGDNPLAELCERQLCYWSNEKMFDDYMIVDRSGLGMLIQMLIDDIYIKLSV